MIIGIKPETPWEIKIQTFSRDFRLRGNDKRVENDKGLKIEQIALAVCFYISLPLRKGE